MTGPTLQRTNRLIFLTILGVGLSVAIIGAVVGVGWVFDVPRLTSWSTDIVPMSPAAAALALLTGIALVLSAARAPALLTRGAAVGLASIVTLAGLTLYLLRLRHIYLPVEQLGLSIATESKGAPLGFIAPEPAVCFSLAGVALVLWHLGAGSTRRRLWATLGGGSIVTGAALGLMLVNLTGGSVVYGAARIPPAINTAAALFLIGIALLALSVRAETAAASASRAGHISRHLPAALFIIFSLAAAVGARTFYQQQGIEVRASANEELTTISRLRLRQLDTWRRERLWDGTQAFLNDGNVDEVGQILAMRDAQALPRTLSDFLSRYLRHAEYDRVVLLTPQGVVRRSLPADAPAWTTPDVVTDALSALTSRRVALRDLFLDPTARRPTLALLIPIIDRSDAEGRPIAVLCLRVNPSATLYPILEGWPGSSRSAESLLVRREGDAAVLLNNLKSDPQAAVQRRTEDTETERLTYKAVHGQLGLIEGLNYRGEPVLGVAAAVPDSPWFLIVQVDRAELDAELRDRLWLILAFVGVLIVGAGSTLTWAWRRQREVFSREQFALATALQESEERLRLAVGASEQGLWDMDVASGTVVISPEFAAIFGVDPAITTAPYSDLMTRVHDDDRARVSAYLDDYLAARRAELRTEFRVTTASGPDRWVTAAGRIVQRSTTGAPTRMLGIVADISERKAAEATLTRSEQALRTTATQLRDLLQNSPTVIYTMRARGEQYAAFEVSENIERLFGYTHEEALVGTWWLDHIVAEDREGALMAVQELETRDDVSHEFRFVRKDASLCWIQDSLHVVERDGTQPTIVVGAWTDVTARKQAELRSARLGQLYQALSECNQAIVRSTCEQDVFDAVCRAAVDKGGMSMAWIGLVDPHTGDVAPVAAAGHGTGYLTGLKITSRADDPLGQGPTGTAIREHRAAWSDSFPDDPATSPWHAQASRYGWVASGALPLTREGRLVGALTIYVTAANGLDDEDRALLIEMASDISYALSNFAKEAQRRAAEARLHESEERYRTIFADNNVPMLLIDPETGCIRDANAAAAQFYGWSEFTLRQMNIADINTLSPDAIQAEMSLVAAGRKKFFDFRHRVASGEILDVEVFSGIVTTEHARLLLSSVIDVTARKKAEAALRDTEARYRALVEHAPVAVFVNRHDRVALVNDACVRLFGAESADQLIGRLAVTLFDPAHAAAIKGRIDRLRQQGINSSSVPERIVRLDGLMRNVEVSAAGFDDGDVTSIHVVLIDVTERHRAEAAVRASLAEKDALLKEVHHRVKNNLQLITSLLRLEAGRTTDAATHAVLGEMQGRILSMALLHETLYRSGNLASIDLGHYLDQLTHQLFRSLAPPTGVQLRLDLASAPVELDQAIPCGLLVNELLSNSLKHGFPRGRHGEVSVRLHAADASGALRLEVRDDGVGLPADMEQRRVNSLGLHLVTVLAKQLQGTLEIGDGPGASFSLVFTPRPAPHVGAS